MSDRAGGVSPNWVLLSLLVFSAPVVWTLGPLVSFMLVVVTVLLPFVAFVTVPLASLVGTMGALWTTLMLRETKAVKAYLQARSR